MSELTEIAKGKKKDLVTGERVGAAILFVVVRGDVTHFRPNHEACPSFAKYLNLARAGGVTVFSHKVVWKPVAEKVEDGKLTPSISFAAYDCGEIPVDLSQC